MSWKDSKFKKFLGKAGDVLKNTGGDVVDIALKAASGNISGAISEVHDLLDSSDDSGSNVLLEELKLKAEEFRLEAKRIDAEDRASARDMQKAALDQGDTFSKRFIYYLALGVFGFSCLVVLLLFFVPVPESNQRVVDMVLGVIVGSGLISVLNYFYGASDPNEKED